MIAGGPISRYLKVKEDFEAKIDGTSLVKFSFGKHRAPSLVPSREDKVMFCVSAYSRIPKSIGTTMPVAGSIAAQLIPQRGKGAQPHFRRVLSPRHSATCIPAAPRAWLRRMFCVEMKPPSGSRTEPPTTSMCVPNLSGLSVVARATGKPPKCIGRLLKSCTKTVSPGDRATGDDPAAHADSVHS